MSMDLYFRSSDGQNEVEAWRNYLATRHHVSMDGDAATYHNEDTGVYFQCFVSYARDPTEPEGYPISIHVNYVRPKFWIREITPFVADFVNEFNFDILDPQIGGMGEGPFDTDRMINGWDAGNKFACSVMGTRAHDLATLPGKRLDQIWRWNMGRNRRQMELKIDRFVARIILARKLDGTVVTVAVWADAIPSVLPPVDFLLIPRQQLAPRKFLILARSDKAILSWQQATELLAQHSHREEDGVLVMRDNQPPREVTRAIRALPGNGWDLTLVNADMVIDSELLSEP